jgi:A/G-specific adenine glycosylase
MKLPGIGNATSGALLAFAFNQPAVFIETNIRSVFIHHFFKDSFDVHDDELSQYVLQTLDKNDPREWYYALMDYGVHLKSTQTNPSRRSTHHKRQSPFHGSNRQLRGKILKLLLTRPSIGPADLFSLLGSDRERTRKIVERLLAEKMIRKKGKMLCI